MDSKAQTKSSDVVRLSHFTLALTQAFKEIKPHPSPDDFSKLTVSQTVSFVALVYERIRNVMEFKEEHMILRSAIERILKRRLTLNPDVKDEAENLLRELLWARYFDNESLGSEDIHNVQLILDRLIDLKRILIPGRPGDEQEYLNQFLMDLVTCEIEETLKPEGTLKSSNFTFFIYQVLRNKIKLEGLSREQRDS